MSTTRLSLYNDALLDVGERRLATITEAREPRYLLDQVWDSGAVDYCLERGMWTFAMRSVKLEYSPSVEPQWGYRRAFDKPTDYVRTAAICSDEFFRVPLREYSDEANFWFAELDTIYVKYVSNDANYGGDMAKWPVTFSSFVSAYLAATVAPKITQDETKALKLEKAMNKALTRAQSNDAMNTPTRSLPAGSWSVARAGFSKTGDRGNGGNLIG